MNKAPTRRSVNAALALGALTLPGLGIGAARAQTKPVKLALIAPLSGPWARQGQLVRLGPPRAPDAIRHKGGVKGDRGAQPAAGDDDAGPHAEQGKKAAPAAPPP